MLKSSLNLAPSRELLTLARVVQWNGGDELEIVNRAKNLHFNNIAKNASPESYTKATEFEALLGYLYLTKQMERLQKFIDISLEEYYASGRN